MLQLAAWLHDLDPMAIPVAGSFGVRWYGIAYLAGFVVAWVWMRALAKRGLIRIPPDAVADVILALVVGVLVGGRLGYALFYRPGLLVDFHAGFPFWGVLEIWRGGMASHGGIAGIFVACWWCARRYKVPALHVLDTVSAVGPVGIFFGRLANFVNGELLGAIAAKPGQPAPWWAVRFPQELRERFAESGRSAEQTAELYDVLGRFGSDPYASPGPAIERAIAAIQRGDALAREQLALLLSARHPSQLYQATAEGLLTLAVVWWVWRRPRRPGVIAGVFGLTYGLGRIATEFIRLPDTHFSETSDIVNAARILGLSRGQWLSVALILAGVILLACARRTGAEKLGGWRKRPAPAPNTNEGVG